MDSSALVPNGPGPKHPIPVCSESDPVQGPGLVVGDLTMPEAMAGAGR